MNENKILTVLQRIEKYSLLAAKNVFTLNDVSLITGLSKSSLYKMTCENRIPYYRPNGKNIYFDRAEVEQWLKQGRVATSAEIEEKAATYVATHGKEVQK